MRSRTIWRASGALILAAVVGPAIRCGDHRSDPSGPESVAARPAEESAELAAVLDRVSTEAFFRVTYVASGWNVVRITLERTEEFAFLEANADEAVPAMVARMRQGHVSDTGLVVYAFLFDQVGSIDGARAFAEWMAWMPDSNRERIDTFTFAWVPAFELIHHLDRGGKLPTDYREAFWTRDRLLENLELSK